MLWYNNPYYVVSLIQFLDCIAHSADCQYEMSVGFRELAEQMLTVYFKWGHGFLSLNRLAMFTPFQHCTHCVYNYIYMHAMKNVHNCTL